MNFKKAIASLIFAAGCIAASLGVVVSSSAQLIYGNTFPFWNVTGPLSAGSFTGVTDGSVSISGAVGEVGIGTLDIASGVTLTTATPKGSACVTLAAGDWDVTATAAFSTTGATYTKAYVSIVPIGSSATINATVGQYATMPFTGTTLTGGSQIVISTAPVAFSSSVTATYCTQGFLTFSAGSAQLYGQIRARRER